MYFCASKDGDGLACDDSPCAKEYLRRLTEYYFQPELIVTFGNRIPVFFRKHLIGITPKVIHLPFRSFRSGDDATMDKAWTGLLVRPMPFSRWADTAEELDVAKGRRGPPERYRGLL